MVYMFSNAAILLFVLDNQIPSIYIQNLTQWAPCKPNVWYGGKFQGFSWGRPLCALQVWGWAEKFIGWLQWSNFTKCGFFFQHIVSPAVHTRLPSVLQRLDFRGYRSSHPDPRKSPQLQIWPHHRSDTASKPQSRTAAITITDLCARALSWWNRTPFVSFPDRLRNVCIVVLLRVLNYLTSVGLSGRNQCSSYQKRLNLMHAKFHSCGTTPS